MTVIKRSNLDSCRNTTEQILFNGLRDLSAAIVQQAQSNVDRTPPSHPQVQTGTLRRSITMDVTKSGDRITGKVGLLKGKTGGNVLVYGPVLELGRRDKTMPPYPYLYPAAKSVVSNAGRYFRRAR